MGAITEPGQRIVTGIDGSTNAAAALAWSLAEAGARHTSVEAIYVWQEPSLAYSAPGYIPLNEREIEAQAQRALDDAMRETDRLSDTRGEDVKVFLRAATGSPVEVLATAAAEHDVGLVVVGAQGHSGLAGILLGSVSHALTHRSPKPLVIVPGSWRVSSNQTSEQNIVVGVDGSPDSQRALAWAVGEARARGVSIDAVIVSAHHGGGTDPLAEAAETLRQVVSEVDTTGINVARSVVEGVPARSLISYASKAQMLVVGNRGLGRAREAISGSVSHACAHHAVVPVVIIPRLQEEPEERKTQDEAQNI